MTFVAPTKTQPLITIVEMAFGANPDGDLSGVTWTDVSAYVRKLVMITKGRPSQTGDADPTKITFTLVNTDGRFTAESPMSPYWPNVVQNVPCRVSRTWAGASAVYERATGFVVGWPIQTNAGVLDVTVAIQAAGRLRRIRASKKTVTSAMTRAIASTAPLAWWPCEDGPQATQAASGLPGGSPMRVDGGKVTFGADAGPAGSANLPDFGGGGQLTGYIPTTTGTAYRVEFAVKFPSIATGGGTSPAALVFPAGGLTNRVEIWEFGANANGEGGFFAKWFGDGGTSSDFRLTNVDLDDGESHHIRLDFSNNSGSTQINITIDNVAVGGSFPWTPVRDWTVPIRITTGPLTGTTKVTSVGEVVVWAPYSSSVDTFAAFGGYANERADARVTRMCLQEGVPVSVISGAVPAQMMGPQLPGTLSENLDDCVNVDNAILHDGGTLGSLVYVSGAALYNAATAMTLDYKRDQISDDDAGAFPGAFDDQYLANQWDISKTSGSSSSYIDPTAATPGMYDMQDSVNAASDGQTLFIAQYRAAIGSYPGYRFPNIGLNLRRSPEKAADLIALTIPGKVLPTNVPSPPYPPGSMEQFAVGYTEALDVDTWWVAFNLLQARTFRTIVVDDPTNPWVLEAAACVLNAGITATANTMQIKTNSGPICTTTATFPADFPRDVVIDGEQIRITAITGTSSPQTANITRSINGVVKSHLANAVIKLYRPAVIPL
jgi:hypothetical protein